MKSRAGNNLLTQVVFSAILWLCGAVDSADPIVVNGKYAVVIERNRSQMLTRANYKALASYFKDEYRNAAPFPNIVFDNLFPQSVVEAAAEEFPTFEELCPERFIIDRSIMFRNPTQTAKCSSQDEETFSLPILQILHHSRSNMFIGFLEELTGISSLFADHSIFGAGTAATYRGGKLGVHADFNRHPIRSSWFRRVSLFLYLNDDWDESFNGALEFWGDDMSEAVRKIQPTIHRVAMFSNGINSRHGLPEELMCPSNRSRNSLALYYYSTEPPPNEDIRKRSTFFFGRKGVEAESSYELYNILQPE